MLNERNDDETTENVYVFIRFDIKVESDINH